MQNSHKKQWDFLKRKFEANQLSHAYLFEGPEKIGKGEFAKNFAEFIGCRFPDLLIVGPGEEREIQIAKIREIQNFLSYRPYYGKFKMVIVESAEKMNQEAQSCFLKTLEEPKGNAIVILVSSMPEMLLSTIYSRCQAIKFSGKSASNAEETAREEEILKSLLRVLSADLSAKFKYAKDVDFEKQNMPLMLKILQKHFRNQLFLKIGQNDESVKKLIKDLKLIQEIENKVTFTNASPKLALEILLMSI